MEREPVKIDEQARRVAWWFGTISEAIILLLWVWVIEDCPTKIPLPAAVAIMFWMVSVFYIGRMHWYHNCGVLAELRQAWPKRIWIVRIFTDLWLEAKYCCAKRYLLKLLAVSFLCGLSAVQEGIGGVASFTFALSLFAWVFGFFSFTTAWSLYRSALGDGS